MDKKRIDWIDIVKGWGMILVVFAHTPMEHPGILNKLIYTFHMPLFFFISGYLFSSKKNTNLNELMRRKFKTLITPYFSFSLVNYMVWIVSLSFNFHRNHPLHSISFYKPILGTFIAIRNSDYTTHNGIFWFVACLFLVEVFFYFLMKYTKGNLKILSISLIICSLLGYLYNTYVHFPLPWSMDLVLTASTFYGFAYVLKEKGCLESSKFLNAKVLTILFVINILLGMLNSQVDMLTSCLGNYFCFYLSAFAGTGFVICFIKLFVKKLKILTYIGQNTLTYLALHMTLIFGIIHFIRYTVFPKTVFHNVFLDKFLLGSTYVSLTFLMLVPIIYFINKFCPFMVGKNYNKQVISPLINVESESVQ